MTPERFETDSSRRRIFDELDNVLRHLLVPDNESDRNTNEEKKIRREIFDQMKRILWVEESFHQSFHIGQDNKKLDHFTKSIFKWPSFLVQWHLVLGTMAFYMKWLLTDLVNGENELEEELSDEDRYDEEREQTSFRQNISVDVTVC